MITPLTPSKKAPTIDGGNRTTQPKKLNEPIRNPFWFPLLALLFILNSSRLLALDFNISGDNFDSAQFGGKGGWSSGRINLPAGTSIGTTPLDLVIYLSRDLTMSNTDGTGRQAFGFGMGGLVPGAATGEVMYQVQITLSKNGAAVATPISFTQSNPFPNTVDNIGSSSSRPLTSTSISFNEVRIRVTSPVTRTVREFSTGLETTQNSLPPTTTEYLVNADNYDPNQFGGKGGWASGRLNLPGGTIIGSTPINLHLKLSKELAIRNYEGTGSQGVGFGIGDFNPTVPSGQTALNFQMKLYLNGNQVAGPIDYAIQNPFPNPSSGLGVGFGWPITSSSVMFNEVRIQVTAPVPRSVTHFETSLQVPPPNFAFASITAAANEIKEGLSETVLTVTRSGFTATPLSINLSLSGSAQHAIDFEMIPSVVHLPAGANQVSIPVKPLNNSSKDGTRNLVAKIAPGTGYGVEESPQAEILIQDDDYVAGTGGLLWEVWKNIGGVSVQDLTSNPKFSAEPDEKWVLNAFEAPLDRLDNFGSRFRGYLHPPVTGNYEFWINSDDRSELWLSSDEDPAHKVQIAHEPEWNGSRNWLSTSRRNPAAPENRSATIHLQAGRKYYVEVLHKEGGGGDNASVAWRLPDGTFQGPIAGQYLSAWGLQPPAPVLDSVTPGVISANDGDVTIHLRGSNFSQNSVALLNGVSVPASWINGGHLQLSVNPGQFGPVRGLKVMKVSVVSSELESNSQLLAIMSPSLRKGSAVAATATQPGYIQLSGESGEGISLAATLLHNGDDAAILAGALFDGNTPGPSFHDPASIYYLLHAEGASAIDSAAARFSYGSNLPTEAEAALELIYFDGSAWQLVQGSGQSSAVKSTSENYIEVAFDESSHPRLSELNNIIFAIADARPKITMAVSTYLGHAGEPIVFSVHFRAIGTPESQTIQLKAGDGSVISRNGNEFGVAEMVHAYSSAGIYFAEARVEDGAGRTASAAAEPIIVVDPSAGSLSGGGWINSTPAGTANAKIHFTLQADYAEGADAPIGKIRIYASGKAGFSLSSQQLQWLVFTPSGAHVSGSGTVEGLAAPVQFLLSVAEGNPDRIRIQAWNQQTGETMFDNQPGSSPFGMLEATSTLLGGGNLTFHPGN